MDIVPFLPLHEEQVPEHLTPLAPTTNTPNSTHSSQQCILEATPIIIYHCDEITSKESFISLTFVSLIPHTKNTSSRALSVEAPQKEPILINLEEDMPSIPQEISAKPKEASPSSQRKKQKKRYVRGKPNCFLSISSGLFCNLYRWLAFGT